MNTQVPAITPIQPNAKKKSFHRVNSTSSLVLRQDAALSEASSKRQHPSTLGHHCTFLTIVSLRFVLVGKAHYPFNREGYFFGNSLNIFIIVPFLPHGATPRFQA